METAVGGLRLQHPYGPVAQLGERCVRNAEVGSSILLLSTMGFSTTVYGPLRCACFAGVFRFWGLYDPLRLTMPIYRFMVYKWVYRILTLYTLNAQVNNSIVRQRSFAHWS